MTWREAPLYVEVQDLARWVSERAAAWPDRGQATLAAKVTGEACSILESVALALTFPATRGADLERADRALARLRVLLRLARELGLLPASGLRFAVLPCAPEPAAGVRFRPRAGPFPAASFGSPATAHPFW